MTTVSMIPASLPLWHLDTPYPSQDQMCYPDGIEHILAHDGRTDILPFLHDVTIAAHEGRIYIAWYNSTDAEICGSSLIRGRHSDDDGKTWSEPFSIVGKIDSAEEHFVPANLFIHDGYLHATITEMTGKNMTSSVHLFRKGEGDTWSRVGQIQHGFICNTPPIRLPDDPTGVSSTSRYISPAWMPMKNSTPAFPAVLLSQGDDISAEWEPVLLFDPLNPASPRIRCPETTLRVDGNRVFAFVRNDTGPAWVFSSDDFGRTWSSPQHFAPMSVGNSKLFAGTLSDGRRYLIYNEDRGYFERSLLVVAFTAPGESQYSKVYKLFDGVEPAFDRGSKWFYPCAVEQDGFLFVACTLQEPSDQRSAVLAKIPVGSL